MKQLAAPLAILAAGVAAYLNSFSGPFLFDDTRDIVENLALRHPWPPWDLLGRSMRPLAELSFAFNYALGGLDVFGFHCVNLIIHLAAALALFGLLRQTLLTAPLRGRYGAAATGLSCATTLLWTLHPLQTQSVTYVVQRAEALTGLWYLLTLYGLHQAAMAPHSRRWVVATVAACALGMASKSVMVTAPLLALLYDRVFLSGSIREALRRRLALHLSLMATWLLPLVLMVFHQSDLQDWNVGFALKGLSVLDYASSQPGVLLHYLRLALWPHPLAFDYSDWPLAKTPMAVWPPALGIGAFLLITLWALRRRPPLGFLGAWFFLILAPTSSVIPLADLVMEHRMYLPLAAVLTLLVLGGSALLARLIQAVRFRRVLATGLVLAVGGILGLATVRRNRDYASEIALWQDTVLKRPSNARAHTYFAAALAERGRLREAIAHYRESLRLRPEFEETHNALGNALIQQGRLSEAIDHYREAIRCRPNYAAAYNNLGNAMLQQGRIDEAMRHFTEALRLKPGYPAAHNNLGNALVLQGKLEEAIAHYGEAIRLNPDYTTASRNFARFSQRLAVPDRHPQSPSEVSR